MSKSVTSLNKYRLDKFGALTSLTCAIHCAAMPLLIGFAPLIGFSIYTNWHLEWIEWLLTFLSLGIGTFSLLPSFTRIHKQWRPLFLFSFGAGLIVTVRLLTTENSHLETPTMVIGALLIACAHIVNHRLCKSCSACHTANH